MNKYNEQLKAAYLAADSAANSAYSTAGSAGAAARSAANSAYSARSAGAAVISAAWSAEYSARSAGAAANSADSAYSAAGLEWQIEKVLEVLGE